MDRVRVNVPASTTNLGPGFDVLGMALKLYNTVEVEVSAYGGGRPCIPPFAQAFSKSLSSLRIEIEGEGADVLPRDESNLVYRAAKRVFERAGEKPPPMAIRLTNRIPLARGLGSSGTAIIGGLMAASIISGAALTQDDILNIAAAMDGHPDNVAASIFGGVVIASPTDQGVVCMKFLPPKPVDVVIVVPDFHLLTSDARSILPASVDLQTAVFNISRTSLLVAALTTGDFRLFGIVMDDKLHQPYREKLIPGMRDVFQAARSVNEKVAVALSGAGPSIVAFCTGNSTEIGKRMQQAFLRNGINSRVMILNIDEEGAVAL